MSTHERRALRPTAVPGAATRADEPVSAASAPPAPLPLAGVASDMAPLVVGRADDPAEQHADRRADAALARLRPAAADADEGGPDPHRHTPGCGHLRRSVTPSTIPGAAVGPAGGEIGGSLTARIEAARGGGAGLAGGERRRMEGAFGASLSSVRVHRGGEAARLNDALSADAFTIGDDVFLSSRAASGGPGAEGVLAHEIAHVLSEPRTTDTVRRGFVTKLFGKKELTEDEKQAAAEKKAEAQRAKDHEKGRAAAVKQSKTTERSENKGLAASREKGVAGREALQDLVYAPGVTGEDESAERMKHLGAQTREALEYEAGLFRFLTLRGSRRSGGKQLSEEEAAEQAYHQTWFVRYRSLESVRPARETAAERLVRQVRQVRTEGDIRQQQLDEDTEADKAVITVRMLSKNVELAYERMANLRDEMMAKDPDRHPALVQAEAADVVRAGLEPKTADQMPPRDGALDVAAWGQATERVAAKKRQAARDRDSIDASMALLPDDQRVPPAPAPEQKDDALEAGSSVLGKIKSYGEPVLQGISGIGGAIAGKLGKPKDAKLREEAGIEKPSYGVVLPSKLDMGISQAAHDSRQAQDWHDKGLPKGPTLPVSTETKVKTGFGQVTSILTGLLGAVQSGFTMAKSIRSAHADKDPYEALKATKAGAAGVDGLVGVAKQTANLAKLIDSGVASGVGQVVPGLDIVSSVLSIVKATMDVAATGMRQRETDLGMFEARARSTNKVDVTVYPLMKVSQVYTKQLENHCWTLGSSIGDLVLSISQVASGGGFGIPAAIKSGKAVLDKLHELGHFIADNVLAVMAQRAQKESEVLHLEGAAEQELSRHPKMAVDGIVVRAALGDPVALQFLSRYRIEGKPITADYVKQIKPAAVRPGSGPSEEGGEHSVLLVKIRTAVLGAMSTSADPKTTYDEIMEQLEKAKGIKGKVEEIRGTWNETGALAQQRNNLATQGRLGDNTKTDRGLGWRVRMFIASEKREKLTRRAAAFEDAEPMPRGVICVIGDNDLGRDADSAAIESLITAVTVADLEAELARKPRRNSPEGIELIRDLLRLKVGDAAVPAGAGAP